MSSGKYLQLKQYLKALPDKLPISPPESRLNRLLNFMLDQDWVIDAGEEVAINQELEAALHDFLPRNDNGIFYIKEQGPGIEALADVLDYWLPKHPGSVILELWLKSAIKSAKKCILTHGRELPEFDPEPQNIQHAPKGKATVKSASSKQSTLNVTHQTTLFNLTAPSWQPKSSATSTKKLDMKALADTINPDYVDGAEPDDHREVADKSKKLACCLASKGCHTTWGWPGDRTRILKHAVACSYLAKMEGRDLVWQAIQELTRKEPGLVNKLMKNMGVAPAGQLVGITHQH
ncbi:uncharacterized protein LACBIDRAFT_334075 [Laccaria bicolor S238N-H82]|uniref:Predicted protein n=1 Tax=Laccaria bicolor (strain S238N-H82 / ATCC MYA-4686) TaxID=486041 RepID=B0DY03_LACBS|nr:uncharacterized protein LACBIDRAFT_334075 [Laccaria bicolor S238N-H82]EDR00600.1 predicted protein [Laccaria bicolor S238N-H82]|eukprot:XP_001888827.1 predicted protein [Laccaria bicolor S238N-H82]